VGLWRDCELNHVFIKVYGLPVREKKRSKTRPAYQRITVLYTVGGLRILAVIGNRPRDIVGVFDLNFSVSLLSTAASKQQPRPGHLINTTGNETFRPAARGARPLSKMPEGKQEKATCEWSCSQL
jgi:hypothetical protein